MYSRKPSPRATLPLICYEESFRDMGSEFAFCLFSRETFGLGYQIHQQRLRVLLRRDEVRIARPKLVRHASLRQPRQADVVDAPAGFRRRERVTVDLGISIRAVLMIRVHYSPAFSLVHALEDEAHGIRGHTGMLKRYPG